MDLLFTRYASPFILLDNYIFSGRLAEFVEEFIRMENEKIMWEFYLYKVNGTTFEEFKKSIRPEEKPSNEQIETTIKKSKDITNDFIP